MVQPEITEKTSEQKRWELLEKNDWLKLSKETIVEGNSVSFQYGILRYSDVAIEEYVMVRIFPPKEKIGTYQIYDVSKAQYYHIFGRGNRISQVRWFSKETGIEVVIDLPGMECNEDLSKEVVEKIVEKGTPYYFAVRRYFKVDTYEGLKKVIEEEKEKR